MTYTEKRLAEFDEMFVQYDQRIINEDGSHDIREVAELVETDPETIKAFLAESIQQAVAEERKRMVREARQTLKKEDSDIVERVIASLDKPLTGNK